MGTPTFPKAAEFSNITDTGQFTKLGRLYDAAVQTISNRCGPLPNTTIVDEVRARNGVIPLTERPVKSITSVVDDEGNPLDLGGHKLRKRAAVLRLRRPHTGYVEVVYVAGWEPYPDDLETAIYVVTDHLWETQRGRSGSFTQIHGIDDDAPVGGDASFFVLKGHALPRRAQELIRDYLKPGFA